MAASELLNHLKFIYNQRVGGFSVSEMPHFDQDGLTHFMGRLSESISYLEYGCGGSTFQAARLRKEFVSIEGDPFFLRAVRKKILDDFGQISGNLIYADIGLTGKWGYPLLKKPTIARLRRWRDYAEKPWRLIKSIPDLILIDGRFRVHCALYSISKTRNHEVEILFDDYERRDHYREIEKFAQLTQMQGRMAVFRPKVSIDIADLHSSIEKYSRDYR